MVDRGQRVPLDFGALQALIESACEGLGTDVKADPVEGIDANMAFRHLGCINGSFEPKHEHKMAAAVCCADRGETCSFLLQMLLAWN